MGLLGERFPPSEKIKFLQRRLVPGCVIHLFTDFIYKPKEKFLLVASNAENPALIVVNTGITDFIKARPHLLNCQILIAVKDHPFLDHDSYLDCGKVYTPYTQDQLKNILLEDVGRLRGDLSASVITDVKRVVRQARTIAPIHKREILGSL